MITWSIVAIITFFYLRWLVKVPCLKETRTLVGEDHPQYSSYYPVYGYIYTPVGMKVWLFLVILLVSLVPILNLIALAVFIVIPIVYKLENNISMEKLFPKGPGKIISFLNKTL